MTKKMSYQFLLDIMMRCIMFQPIQLVVLLILLNAILLIVIIKWGKKKSAPKEKTKRSDYMKQYRAEKSSEMKRKNAEYNKKYRTKNISICNAKHAEYMRQYQARKKSADKANDKSGMIKCSFDKTIESLISKFHVTISEGPVYICTCCNQLWYKHIVCAMSVVLEQSRYEKILM